MNKNRLTFTQKFIGLCCVVATLYSWIAALRSGTIESAMLAGLLTSSAGSLISREVFKSDDSIGFWVRIAFLINLATSLCGWCISSNYRSFTWPMASFIGLQIFFYFNQYEDPPIPG